MRIILALRGPRNSGKTITIGMLYEMLNLNGYNLIGNPYNGVGNDFTVYFEKKGKPIGITSYGDTYKIVHDKLDQLINNNCEICICACRTFDRVPPGTNAAILEFIKYTPEFYPKTITKRGNQSQINQSDAEELFKKIEVLLK